MELRILRSHTGNYHSDSCNSERNVCHLAILLDAADMFGQNGKTYQLLMK